MEVGGVCGWWLGGFLRLKEVVVLSLDCVPLAWQKPSKKKADTGAGRRGKSEEEEQQRPRGQELDRRGKSSEEEQHPGGQGGTRKALWAKRLLIRIRVQWAPSGCPGWLCAGRPPCKQGWVFAFLSLAFCHGVPLAARREGNPVRRRVRPPPLRTRGGNGALPTPSPPCKRGRALPLGTFVPAGSC